MEQYFASLSKRQTMMLLTAITFGGDEALECFEHLPDEDQELLKHRGKAVLQIPRDKRIPMLVQEIKRLMTSRRGDLRTADPARLALLLQQERPALIEVVLRALPGTLAEDVRSKLPSHTARLRKEVRPEILSIVRWRLTVTLRKLAGERAPFKFADVLILQSRELVSLCDRMGARVLATAVAGLPEAERDRWLEALPPDQRALAAKAAAAAGIERALPEGDARAVLTNYGAVDQPSTGLRSAGVQRLARACIAQSPEFAQRVVQQHPGEIGRMLAHWLREESHREVLRGDGGRSDIVNQLERLAQKGVIDRPMRLPPPPKRLAEQEGEKPVRAKPGGMLPRPPPPGPGGGASPRRDFMAEREARKAGALSARAKTGEKLMASRGPLQRPVRRTPEDERTHDEAERAARRVAAADTGNEGAEEQEDSGAGRTRRRSARGQTAGEGGRDASPGLVDAEGEGTARETDAEREAREAHARTVAREGRAAAALIRGGGEESGAGLVDADDAEGTEREGAADRARRARPPGRDFEGTEREDAAARVERVSGEEPVPAGRDARRAARQQKLADAQNKKPRREEINLPARDAAGDWEVPIAASPPPPPPEATEPTDAGTGGLSLEEQFARSRKAREATLPNKAPPRPPPLPPSEGVPIDDPPVRVSPALIPRPNFARPPPPPPEALQPTSNIRSRKPAQETQEEPEAPEEVTDAAGLTVDDPEAATNSATEPDRRPVGPAQRPLGPGAEPVGRPARGVGKGGEDGDAPRKK
jgi:hypothetical protein